MLTNVLPDVSNKHLRFAPYTNIYILGNHFRELWGEYAGWAHSVSIRVSFHLALRNTERNPLWKVNLPYSVLQGCFHLAECGCRKTYGRVHSSTATCRLCGLEIEGDKGEGAANESAEHCTTSSPI